MLICVIVTYGLRQQLLYATLRSILAAGVDRAVVVDNASGWNVRKHLTEDFGEVVDVVSHAQNLGSAGGFGAGLARALSLGAQELLLLDDDLGCPAASLTHLRATLHQVGRAHGLEGVAVVAYRPSHMAGIVSRTQDAHGLEVTPPFLRFSLAHLLRSLASLVLRRDRSSSALAQRAGEMPSGLCRVPYAPYGGLLLHRRAVESIGLPDLQLLLYWDDIEWTYRLNAKGGALFIDCDAPLEELEISMAFRARHLTRIHGLLLREGDRHDSRVYYEVRNTAYFAIHVAAPRIRWPATRLRGLSILARLLGTIHSRPQRAQTIARAIRDGMAADLGLKPNYPLE